MPPGMPDWPHRADEAEAATLFAIVFAHATLPFSLPFLTLAAYVQVTFLPLCLSLPWRCLARSPALIEFLRTFFLF